MNMPQRYDIVHTDGAVRQAVRKGYSERDANATIGHWVYSAPQCGPCGSSCGRQMATTRSLRNHSMRCVILAGWLRGFIN